MSRIPYKDPAHRSAVAAATVEAAPINLTRMLAGASDGVIEGFGALMRAFYGPSRLPADLREAAILAAGHAAGSSYEVMQHEALARRIGFDAAALAALRDGDHDALPPARGAVATFARELTLHVRAGDAALAAVRAHLDDEQLIDLILLVGAYRMVAGLLETAGVEHDDAPLGWMAG